MSAAEWRSEVRNLPDLKDLPEAIQARIELVASRKRPPCQYHLFGAVGGARPMAAIVSRGWIEWYLRRGRRPDSSRPSIPRRIREEVLARDGLICGICRGAVEAADVHLDHIEPWSRGGPSTLENLRVTHSLCNIRRGAGRDV
jgi:5-methylcytosine-specific restriction endonuclease McrA